MVRRVIFNADDYGRCAEINAATEELIDAGRLRDVSVLANGPAWETSVAFLLARPHVSAGAHLNVVEGRPVSQTSEVRWLTDANGQFVGLRGLMLRWFRHPRAVSRAVESEWRAQMERLRLAGLRLWHADSHQHLHAFPPAWRCAVKLCQEYGLPSLRLPRERNELALRRAGAIALNASLAVGRLSAANNGKRHNDHFLGFKRAGAYGIEELVGDLRHLSPGVTEIALHPSTKDETPYPTLFGNRERRALLDASMPDGLAAMGVEMTTWRDVAR